MAVEVNNRKYDRLHKAAPWHDGTFTGWAKEYSDATPFHYRDGVDVWASRVDHGLGGDFLSPDA